MANRKIYSKSEPLLPLQGTPQMNKKYHVSWGKSNGVVGYVVHINETDKTVIMRSPSTGIDWKNPVKWIDLRLLRKDQQKLESNNS